MDASCLIYELWGVVKTTWQNWSQYLPHNLLVSMLDRTNAVLKAKGGQTKY